jgi:transposase
VVTTPAHVPAPGSASAGTITLEVGRVRLRIDGKADTTTLAQVLKRVLR